MFNHSVHKHKLKLITAVRKAVGVTLKKKKKKELWQGVIEDPVQPVHVNEKL